MISFSSDYFAMGKIDVEPILGMKIFPGNSHYDFPLLANFTQPEFD